jgi:hypothetical protein
MVFVHDEKLINLPLCQHQGKTKKVTNRNSRYCRDTNVFRHAKRNLYWRIDRLKR